MVTCLDNVSDLQPWLQDAICRAVTGDGMLRRQLYTDADVSVLAFKRVVALTSIDPGSLNGDLADRLLTVELERITDDDRMSEEDIVTKWRDKHPVVLGGLLDTAVDVLAILPKIQRKGLPRMADFARILLAVDKVLGTSGFDRFAAQAGRTAEQVADSDNVLVAIRGRIIEPWTGTASELLTLLTPDRAPKDWPASPQAMGGRLSRGAPVLRRLGWTVDRLPRSDKKGSRGWSLTPPPDTPPPTEEAPAGMSDTSEPPHGGDSDMSDNGAGTSSHTARCACPCHRGAGGHDGHPCPRCNENTEPL